MTNSLAIFEGYKIRRHFDEKTQNWYFSVVDILQVLIQQPDFQTARNYWKVLKNRLNKEGSESVTKCNEPVAQPPFQGFSAAFLIAKTRFCCCIFGIMQQALTD